MQCLGLTVDRKRCPALAINETGYCAEHQPTEPDVRSAEMLAREGWLDKLMARPAPPRIPDDVRHRVAGSLKNKPTAQVCEVLLHHPSVDMRWDAAFALRKRRDPAAIEALWQALHNDPVGLVRQQAAVALGKIGTRAVLGPLIEALWHDRDAGVRQACAIALGNLGYAIASQDLVKVLGRDIATFVRWDCALALGQLGDRTVEGLLNELAQNDPSPVVRNACKEALEAIKK
jgi:HEAT repeat protein